MSDKVTEEKLNVSVDLSFKEDNINYLAFERPEYKNRGIRDLANSIGNEGLHSYLGLYNPLAGSVHGYNSTANIRMFNRGDGTIDLGIANNVNPEEVEEFARNICKEKSIDFDKQFGEFMNNFKK